MAKVVNYLFLSSTSGWKKNVSKKESLHVLIVLMKKYPFQQLVKDVKKKSQFQQYTYILSVTLDARVLIVERNFKLFKIGKDKEKMIAKKNPMILLQEKPNIKR